MKGNPYVGPRPYERADRENFYGRNREARDLLSLILAERVVLFYAPSGAGKTSLLNAEVIPALEDELFNILPVVRVANDLPPKLDDDDVNNIFVFSVLMSLVDEDAPLAPLGNQTLTHFLQSYLPNDDQPPLLIIDQFEELFTAHRHRWQDAEGFFVQVKEALDALPTLGVVFAMREDYVAEVEPYAPLLPRRLRARFRMERLGVEGALEAVRKPAESAGIQFDENVAEQLVDDLRCRKMQRYGRDDEVEVLGHFVEPVQLQVVCHRLWANLPEQDDALIQWEEVEQYGDIDRALVDFYETAIARAHETGVPERDVRRWVAEHLITSAGTRGLAMRGPEETAGLSNDAIDVLDAQHLIRSDMRAGARWYELVHDRLIDPIRQSNRVWEAARQTPLRTTAKRWQETEDEALLYMGATLEDALSWAERHAKDLEPYEKAFLDASRQADQARRRAQRLRILGAVIAGIVLVVVSLLAWAAMRNGMQAYSRELAAKARSALETDRQESIWLARAGTQPSFQGWWRNSSQSLVGELDTVEAQIMLRRAVQDYYPEQVYTRLAGQAYAVTYDKQGRFLYVAMPDTGIEVIDTKVGGQQLLSLPAGRDGAVYEVTLDPDGRYLAAGGDDGKGGIVEIWDTETERWVASLRASTPTETYDEIYAVAYSPLGNYLATGGDYGYTLREFRPEQDGLVRVWTLGWRGNTLVPQLSLTLDDPTRRVADVAFKGDAAPIEAMYLDKPLYLAAASYDSTVWLWELETTGPTQLAAGDPRQLRDHTGPVEAVAFSPTEPLLASASADKTIRLWDLETGEAMLTLIGHTAEVKTLAFSADGHYLVSGSRDRTVRLWDVRSRNPSAISVLTGPGNLVLDVDFSPDNRFVIAGSGDNTVHIWDRDFPRQVGLSTLAGHSGYVRAVEYSPDGTFLASAGGEGEIRIWSQVHGTLVQEIQDYFGDEIWDLTYSPNGAYLVSCASDDVARVWDTATGKRIATLRGHESDVERAFFTPDGRFLITVAKDEQALIWQTADWSLDQRVPIPSGGLWGGTLSPAGDRMALGYFGGSIYLFDLQTEAESLTVTQAVTLTGHTSYVPALDFSPDGRYLVSGAWDGTARIWSMETMTTVATPLEHPAFVYDVAFSQDGQYLATAARDSQVRLWQLEDFPAQPPTLAAVLAGHTDPVVYTIDFSPDGRYLASGSWDGTVRRHLVRFEDVLELSWQYVGREYAQDTETNEEDSRE